MKNFWQKIKPPVLALAPMAGFSDSAFRQVCKKYGADVLYSEMASATALYYGERAKNRLAKNATLELLKFNRTREKYYVVQLFGSEPEHFAVAARIITKEIKPDGIDINFGCPVPKIVRQGAGSGLMKDLKKSRAVIEAVLENTNLPVSIKIRARSGEVEALRFLENLSGLPIAAVMIHGRTLAQGFSGAPDFTLIKKTCRHFKGVILANGGINDLESAQKALKASGADGLGLARGCLGRPWLFKEIKAGREINFKPAQIFKIALEHASLEQKQKGKSGIVEMRKHLVWYVQGLPGAAKLREQLVKVEKLSNIKKVLGSINF